MLLMWWIPYMLVASSGFTFVFSQLCDGQRKIFTTRTGNIADGDGRYQNKQQCEWLIKGDVGETVTILFHFIDLEFAYDFLYIYDGSSSSSKVLAVVNGVHQNVSFSSTSNFLYFKLQTDVYFAKDGFNSTYSINRCPDCGQNRYCNNGICECFPTLHGPSCQHKWRHFCNQGGKDAFNDTLKKCVCEREWYGEDCSISTSANSNPNTWGRLSSWSPAFNGRMAHVSGYIPLYNVLLIHGGYDLSGVLDDLMSFDLSENEWQQIATNSTPPIGRFSHSAVVYQNCLLIFGGELADHTFTNELWKFNVSTNLWSLLNDSLSDNGTVPRLAGHTMTLVGDKVYVIGGKIYEQSYSTKVYSYDLISNTWHVLPPAAHGKTSRLGLYGHTASYYEKTRTIVLFGGFCFEYYDSTGLADSSTSVWLFNIDTNSWLEISNAANSPLHPLIFHTSVIIGDYMIVQGGWNKNSSDVSDISQNSYFYNLHCHVWLSIPSNSLLSKRYGHTAVLKDQQTIIIAGGYNRMIALYDVLTYKVPQSVSTLDESGIITYGSHCNLYNSKDSCLSDPSCLYCHYSSQCFSAYGNRKCEYGLPIYSLCPGLCASAAFTCESCTLQNNNCTWCSLTNKCAHVDSPNNCYSTTEQSWWGSDQMRLLYTPKQCQEQSMNAGLTVLQYRENGKNMNLNYPDNVEIIKNARTTLKTIVGVPVYNQIVKVHGFIYPFLKYLDAAEAFFKVRLSTLNPSLEMYLGLSNSLADVEKVATVAAGSYADAKRESGRALFPVLPQDRYSTSNLRYYFLLNGSYAPSRDTLNPDSFNVAWNESKELDFVEIPETSLRPYFTDQCSAYTSCGGCIADASCGWCSLRNTCMYRSEWNNCQDNGSMVYLARSYSECIICQDYSGCELCIQDSFCAWDSYTNRCDLKEVVPRPFTESCQRSCSSISDLQACLSKRNCIWCDVTQKCFPQLQYNLVNQYSQCNRVLSDPSQVANECESLLTCKSCLREPNCGWCYDNNENRNGSCTSGSFLSPAKNCAVVFNEANITHSDSLSWAYDMCPDVDECLWKMDDCGNNSQCLNTYDSYECPCDPGYEGDGRTYCEKTCWPACVHGICNKAYKCECFLGWIGENCSVNCGCNGHSTCVNKTGVCDRCQHNTAGAHCELCTDGAYGNATSPLGCTKCDCNGHGDPDLNLCNPQNGTCFCKNFTTGRTCSECLPGYIGNPKTGACYLECRRSHIITNHTEGYLRPVTSNTSPAPFTTCLWVVASEYVQKHTLFYGGTITFKNEVLLKVHQTQVSCSESQLSIYDGVPPNPRLSHVISVSPFEKLATLCGSSLTNQVFRSTTGVLSIFYEGVSSSFNLNRSVLSDGFFAEFVVLRCPFDCPKPYTCQGDKCTCPNGYHGNHCQNEDCPDACNLSKGQGTCDQLKQECVCQKGFSGIDCSIIQDQHVYTIGTLQLTLDNMTEAEQAQYGSTMVSYGASLFVYGGVSTGVDFFECDLENNRCMKILFEIEEKPKSRHLHCAFVYKEYMYIYGGITEDGISKEMWKYNFNTTRWTYVDKSAVLITVAGHTCTLVDDVVYIIGGYIPAEGLSEYIAAYNLTAELYYNLKQNGLEPTGMYGHVAIHDKPSHLIYLHGGIAFYAEKAQASDRLYAFDVVRLTWNLMEKVAGETIPRLVGHVAHVINGTAFVVGGYSDELGYNNDIYTWDVLCNHWRKLLKNDRYWSINGNLQRQYAASALFNNTIYMFGGFATRIVSEMTSLSPRTIPPCYMYSTNVNACLASTYDCNWCENTQLGISECVHNTTLPGFCLHSNATMKSGRQCTGDVQRKRSCSTYTSCLSCLSSQTEAFEPCHWCRCQGSVPTCRTAAESCPCAKSYSLDKCFEFTCETSTCRNCDRLTCMWSKYFSYVSETVRRFSFDSVYPYNCFSKTLISNLNNTRYIQAVTASLSLYCPDPCSSYTSCSSCIDPKVKGDYGGTLNCYWSEQSRCISPILLPMFCLFGSCGQLFQPSAHTQCPKKVEDFTQCSDCLGTPLRGWCANNGDGGGSCLTGGFAEPSSAACGAPLRSIGDPVSALTNYSSNFTWAYAVCPIENECSNGHHRCRDNEKCIDFLEGYMCECQTGFKQDKNAGTCEPVCKQGCDHGICVAPDDCNCTFGWSSQNCSVPCDCHGNSNCLVDNPKKCLKCLNNTKGESCEICETFFVGDPEHGVSCTPCYDVCNQKSDMCLTEDEYRRFSKDLSREEMKTYIKESPKHPDEVVCLNCSNFSEGKKCESCIDGYFGRKDYFSGTCQKCVCNGHAFVCNKTTGEGCMCTQNTMSDVLCKQSCFNSQCTKCLPDFVGEPKDNKQCYKTIPKEGLDVVVMTSQRTSFYVTKPSFTNVDIRLIIDVLEGEVDIYVTDSPKEYYVIVNETTLAHTLDIAGKRDRRSVDYESLVETRKAGDAIINYVDYDGGVLSIASARRRIVILFQHEIHELSQKWFYVGVSTIQSNQAAVLLVYYRQDLPRIDLTLFFLILIVLFLLILTALILIWKLRHDHERQRGQQNLQKQAETMANRPFAVHEIRLVSSDAMDVIRKRKTRRNEIISSFATSDKKHVNSSLEAISPLAIQPTEDNIACVTTVMVQFPENELSLWNLSLASTLSRSRHQQLVHVRTTHNAVQGRKIDTRISTTSL